MLESAARGLSRYGYGNLVLEEVAREAGYTRGALYHQFKDKEDLALAVIDWVDENWMREVGEPAEQEPDPVAELLALARGHAVFCRRDIARVVMALQARVRRPGPSGRARDRADLGDARQALRPADQRRAQRRLDPAGTARPGGRAGVAGRARGRRDRARRTGAARRAAGRARRRGRTRGRQPGLSAGARAAATTCEVIDVARDRHG